MLTISCCFNLHSRVDSKITEAAASLETSVIGYISGRDSKLLLPMALDPEHQ
jgi:hypothetical protein